MAPGMAINSNRAELQNILTDMNTAIRDGVDTEIHIEISEGYVLYTIDVSEAKAAQAAAEAEKKRERKPKKTEAVEEAEVAEDEE